MFGPLEESIQPSKNTLAELVTKEIAFPATQILNTEAKLACGKCTYTAPKDESKLFKWMSKNCNMICLKKNVKECFTFKALFEHAGQSTTLTLYHRNIVAYFNHRKIRMPQLIDEILEFILVDEETKIIIDNKSSIIGYA